MPIGAFHKMQAAKLKNCLTSAILKNFLSIPRAHHVQKCVPPLTEISDI